MKQVNPVNPAGHTTAPDGRVVEIGYRIYKIYDIKTTEDSSVTVDFRLFLRWKDEAVSEITADTWKPHIDFSNLLETSLVDENFEVETSERKGQKKGYVRWHIRQRAKLFQQLDLSDFPFDDHTLRIVVRIPRDIDKSRIVADEGRVSGKQVDGATMNMFALQEWMHYPPKYSIVSDGEHTEKQQFHVELPVRRHFNCYIFSNYTMMCMLTTLSFFILISPADNVTDRLDLTFSLLISVIAFKFVLADKIPDVNYMTRMDVYVCTCLLFLFLIALESAILSFLSNNSDVDIERANLLFGIVLVLLWVSFNVFQIVTKKMLVTCQSSRLGTPSPNTTPPR